MTHLTAITFAVEPQGDATGTGGSIVLDTNLSLAFFCFVFVLSSSELLLGAVATNFTFLPKHTANSYR